MLDPCISHAINTWLTGLVSGEANDASVHMSESESAIQKVDATVQNLDRLRQELLDHLAERNLALKKTRNTLASIHVLPTEILVRVFAATLEAEWRSQFDKKPDIIKRLVEISSVSSCWFHIIRQAPSLWSKIHLGHPSNALAFRRSQETKIDVSYNGPSELHNQDAKFLSMVASYCCRWRSIQAYDAPAWLAPLFAGVNLPLLEVLRIDMSSAVPERLAVYTLPSTLRELRLNRVAVPWPEEGLPSLKNFYFYHVGTNLIRSSGSLLTFLGACPSLETITLFRLGHDRLVRDVPSHLSLTAMAPHISLPHLKSIHIEHVMETLVADFLRSIRADNLTAFTLKAGFEGQNLVTDVVLEALSSRHSGWSPIRTVVGNHVGVMLTLRALPDRIKLCYYDPNGGRTPLIKVTIPGNDWREKTDHFLYHIRLDPLDAPTHLIIDLNGISTPDSLQVKSTSPDKFSFLDRIPRLTKLSIQDSEDRRAQSVIQFLSTPFVRKYKVYPCRQLAAIRLQGDVGLAKLEAGALGGAVSQLIKNRKSIKVYDSKRREVRPKLEKARPDTPRSLSSS